MPRDQPAPRCATDAGFTVLLCHLVSAQTTRRPHWQRGISNSVTLTIGPGRPLMPVTCREQTDRSQSVCSTTIFCKIILGGMKREHIRMGRLQALPSDPEAKIKALDQLQSLQSWIKYTYILGVITKSQINVAYPVDHTPTASTTCKRGGMQGSITTVHQRWHQSFFTCSSQDVLSRFHCRFFFKVITRAFVLSAAQSLTVTALSAIGGRIRLADGAALAVGDVHLLAVAQVLTLDLVAENLTVVAHANAAWFRFPDVPVGVHLAVHRAAQLITWSARETEEDSC